MAWTIYQSTDGSAPVLTGVSGSLITVLDAVLVNGYGSKPAAGWTHPFAGSSTKQVYLSGGSASMYYRVDDTGGLAQGGREAGLRGYGSMSDVDTGTDPFPSVAQKADGCQIYKSENASATAVPWLIAADNRTMIFFAWLAGVGRWQPEYIGEIESFKSGDTHNAVIIAAPAGTASEGYQYNFLTDLGETIANTVIAKGKYIARLYTGAAGSVEGMTMAASVLNKPITIPPNACGFGWLGQYNPADGGVYMGDILFCYPKVSYTTFIIHGKLRGIFPMYHSYLSGWNDGDQFAGIRGYAGHSYRVMKLLRYRLGATSTVTGVVFMGLEISNTVA